MKYKTFMTLHTIVLAYFGFGMLLFPELLWQTLYGIDVSGNSIWFIRLLGVHVVVNMVLSWASRGMANNPGRLAILTTFSGGWLAVGLVFLWGQLLGTFNLLNWSNVAAAFVFSFGLYQYRNRDVDA